MLAFMKRIICWCALLFCAACNPAPKLKQSILTVVDSPAAKRQLLIVRQDPGALGSYSTAVFVRDKGDRELGERVFVAKGEPKVEARWQSEGRVVIAHDAKKEDVFTSAPASGTVAIEYTALKKTDFSEAVRNLKQP